MEGISDICIISMDEKRPPLLRKEPYIDLFFQLSHKAPADWCRDFTDHSTSLPYKASMDADDSLFIKTWVRSPDEIPAHLRALKSLVTACNTRYIENIETSTRNKDAGNDKLKIDSTPQGQLNRITAGLHSSQ